MSSWAIRRKEAENSGHLLSSESSVCRSLFPYRNPWQVFPYMGVSIHDVVTLTNEKLRLQDGSCQLTTQFWVSRMYTFPKVMSLCAFPEEERRNPYFSVFFFGGGVFLDWSMTVVEYLKVYKQPFHSIVSWSGFTVQYMSQRVSFPLCLYIICIERIQSLQ